MGFVFYARAPFAQREGRSGNSTVQVKPPSALGSISIMVVPSGSVVIFLLREGVCGIGDSGKGPDVWASRGSGGWVRWPIMYMYRIERTKAPKERDNV